MLKVSIFTKFQEQQLIYSSDIYFGLSSKEEIEAELWLIIKLTLTQFRCLLFYLYQFNSYHFLKYQIDIKIKIVFFVCFKICDYQP